MKGISGPTDPSYTYLTILSVINVLNLPFTLYCCRSSFNYYRIGDIKNSSVTFVIYFLLYFMK